MKTFSVQTLGCKVNQYEGEQLATLLRSRGLVPADAPDRADLRIVHTCSVTMQAASKSRQTVRRAVRLPILKNGIVHDPVHLELDVKAETSALNTGERPRVVVTGCWATSDRGTAETLPGVDAVITHRQDVAAELDRLLSRWLGRETTLENNRETPSEPRADDGWMSLAAGTPAGRITQAIKAPSHVPVNRNLFHDRPVLPGGSSFASLPVLGEHQAGRQRAFLKVQDGCDAHCTYCIIPKLRPNLWSKPIDAAVEEAKALVDAGHVEIVLTGIFLGAFGQTTALRRRQGDSKPIGQLVDALCTRVPGLRRLRLSSLEPGDLTADLISILKSHRQVVPHFHLPLQSGSDRLLRRMNRQYIRGDYFEMLDRVQASFDRPALTTDVIVGFPGETDDEFERTVEVVERAGFIHVHAFSFSPRPGTAAARWARDFVHGPVVNERIERLTQVASAHSFKFRQQFLGETVELLIEAGDGNRGRCERYFDVTLAGGAIGTGDCVRARITHVTRNETLGEAVR